ncbi:hypothetical protein LTR66_005422, partial [Elasticomyces elasticus]
MPSSSNPPPHGIYVPVPTFFKDDKSFIESYSSPPLDLETQAEHSLFLVRGGVKGLVILGSTGEAIHVSDKERIDLIKSSRETLDKKGFTDRPIVAGTATQSVEQTVEQLRTAKEAGAAYGMVLAPGYFAPAVSQEGITKFFQAVAHQSPIPIMIYHYPGVTNSLSISPSTFETLAAHPNIVGCKLSHFAMDDHTLIA